MTHDQTLNARITATTDRAAKLQAMRDARDSGDTKRIRRALGRLYAATHSLLAAEVAGCRE